MSALRSISVASGLSLIMATLLSGPAKAAIFTLGASTQGWYRDRDGLNIRFFSQPSRGSIYPSFIGSYDDPFFGVFNYNSYFIFDVSNVASPVEKATLRLPIKQYFSNEKTEEISLFDVEASPAALVNNFVSLANYEDLGSGVKFGQQTLMVTQPPRADEETILLSFIDIALTAAGISAINQAIQGSGQFALGASLTSLNNSPYIFSTGAEATEGISFADGQRTYPQFPDQADALAAFEFPGTLLLDTNPPDDPRAVPEPSSILTLGILGTALALSAAQKQRQQ